ncbi:peptidase T [Conexibacter sp. DBS9H8]|uniref:peptidase T n=1 Tax=Conexibacter sp. DBS9H8 TaxID=2937801 RepID=UPI00200EA01F|nr:peptidase T [Conexibacter sp. DBS9H8]
MPAPYTSELAATLAPDLLARFDRYVRIDTQSADDASGTPSTAGQLELGRQLAEELRALGVTDVDQDAHGYVTATVPGTVPGAPVIGVIAHLDTTPEAPGRGVEPIVHRDYDGGVIELPRGGTRLDPATVPELASKRGHDIITASGDTLLGADDKAGVAAIMAAVAHLAADSTRPRAMLRVAFTPDEEIGSLAAALDLNRFGARCAYTLDGSEIGELAYESFCAKEVRLHITGVDVHPGSAKGIMVSALVLMAAIVAALPRDRLTPATTEGRDGFIHPLSLTGTPSAADCRLILRDFDPDQLDAHVALLRATATEVLATAPRAQLTITVKDQYANMRAAIEADPDVLRAAEEAYRAEGIEPVHTPIRGGTDGASLSLRGLPTPNLFTGGHEYHSVREWASLQDMAAASAVVVHLAEAWGRR